MIRVFFFLFNRAINDQRICLVSLAANKFTTHFHLSQNATSFDIRPIAMDTCVSARAAAHERSLFGVSYSFSESRSKVH